MKYPPGFIEETIRMIINNLNDDREYLGLQLGLAQGLISQRTYDKERAPYLVRAQFKPQELALRTKILIKFIGSDIDSETIMTSFRCTIEEADATLRILSEDEMNVALRGLDEND